MLLTVIRQDIRVDMLGCVHLRFSHRGAMQCACSQALTTSANGRTLDPIESAVDVMAEH